jgi:hypothetical protein
MIKYVKIPRPIAGHTICSVEKCIDAHFAVKLLRHDSTIMVYPMKECSPLTETETAQVDMLLASIAHHENFIAEVKKKIEEREEALRKMGLPPAEPFIG